MTLEWTTLHLTADRVRYSEDVETLRVLRNMTTGTYSTFNGEITPDQQSRWWDDQRGRVHAWLYWLRDADLMVSNGIGFGLLRRTADGRWWATVGVDPQFTGRGYGGAIMADLIRKSGDQVFSTARRDNPAGIKLHRARDWDEITNDDHHLIAFQTKPHVHLR